MVTLGIPWLQPGVDVKKRKSTKEKVLLGELSRVVLINKLPIRTYDRTTADRRNHQTHFDLRSSGEHLDPASRHQSPPSNDE